MRSIVNGINQTSTMTPINTSSKTNPRNEEISRKVPGVGEGVGLSVGEGVELRMGEGLGVGVKEGVGVGAFAARAELGRVTLIAKIAPTMRATLFLIAAFFHVSRYGLVTSGRVCLAHAEAARLLETQAFRFTLN
jgi:hypothetical protein